MSEDKNIFTIAATKSFAMELATYCDNLAATKNIPLSMIKIFLPTRRGARTLQEAFLQLSGGKPRLLPIMQSIGDADLEEIQLRDVSYVDSPPAIDSMRRQMVLARLLERAWPHDYNYQQALYVAADLGSLIDQIHTENIDVQTLPDILDRQELAEHWQMTSQFLVLMLNDLWPNYLQSEGMIDPGLHRRLKIESLTQFYKNNPPKTPVIMAGSTGSLPATRAFIKTLLNSDEGYVILPSLDQEMDERSWFHVGGGHPQDLLKKLLSSCQIEPETVEPLGGNDADKDRLFLASEMMRPAQTTEKWPSFRDPDLSQKIENAINGVTYCEGETDHHEAMIIALAMLDIAADPDQKKTATLITPDRYLAMRVQANLRQWNIDIDDSGGTSLPNTSLGQYALSILKSYLDGQIYPIPFLTCLKNGHIGGGEKYDGKGFRNDIRRLEKDVFRGVRPQGDLKEIAVSHPKHHDFLNYLADIFAPLERLQIGSHGLKSLIAAHVKVMENLAAMPTESGAQRLWVGDAGEAMANFFATLQRHDDVTPSMNLRDYIDFIEGFMARQNYSARYGKHPRLSILGQIEARMVQSDRIILAGLNEGVWPAYSGFDVWMSRDMRRRFELPSYDQKTSLSAHDFFCGFCAPDVFITRSKKSGGQPTLKSRWINRLETVLQAADIDKNKWPHGRGEIYGQWANQILIDDENNMITPIDRPAPRPALDRRPTQFSVTDIEKWMRDPYWIYAKKILKLRQWDDVDMEVTMADRGTLIHDTLEEFTKAYPNQFLPDNALDVLVEMGEKTFATHAQNPEIHGFWWPRFTNAASWVIDHEKNWRGGTDKIYSEVKGTLSFTMNDVEYHLTGKADRIEKRRDGVVSIIDYKTGAAPSPGDVVNGLASQLPLEAYLLQQGAFDGFTFNDDQSYDLLYWEVSGNGDGGAEKIAQGKKQKDNTHHLITEAAQGLYALVSVFHDPNIPYYGSPNADMAMKTDYNDYAHLERIAEWSISNASDEDIAA